MKHMKHGFEMNHPLLNVIQRNLVGLRFSTFNATKDDENKGVSEDIEEGVKEGAEEEVERGTSEDDAEQENKKKKKCQST